MYETLTANRTGTVRHAHDAITGQRMIVAPMVMLVEGVHAGSEGPLLYAANELRRSAAAWAGVSVTLNHPQDANGSPVSASHPAAVIVGYVMNGRFEDGKLKADAWIDPTRSVDIVKMIDQRKPIEVSTGVFVTHEAPGGEFGGKAYRAAAVDLRPDHLAILPDGVGACSVKCGCGMLANSEPAPPILTRETMFPADTPPRTTHSGPPVLDRPSTHPPPQDDDRGPLRRPVMFPVQ